MIEVEKQFILPKQFTAWLTENAELIGRKRYTDTYFDTKNRSLSSADTWLRRRGNRYELKIGIKHKQAADQNVQTYTEITTQSAIADYLGIRLLGSFKSSLAQFGYSVFASFSTTRHVYRYDNYTITFDQVNYGYNMGEIELLVQKESEINAAADAITMFATTHNIPNTPIRDKVMELLYRTDRTHYQAVLLARR